mmetsp:Transcript_90420/g.156718  ORF Transcript_90420/g.156718 Transcript_90420/m.156718 type:complete len:122 (-) Transcript_90420:2-367(-)
MMGTCRLRRLWTSPPTGLEAGKAPILKGWNAAAGFNDKSSNVSPLTDLAMPLAFCSYLARPSCSALELPCVWSAATFTLRKWPVPVKQASTRQTLRMAGRYGQYCDCTAANSQEHARKRLT